MNSFKTSGITNGSYYRIFWFVGQQFEMFTPGFQVFLKQFFLLALAGRNFFEMFVGHRGSDATTWGALYETGLD